MVEPRPNYVSAHKRRPKRLYAVRKPKDYVVEKPGDLVQLDTLDIRPLPDVLLKRAHRTHTEEFYEVSPCSWTVTELNRQLLEWENIYNHIRPHQALGYLTPAECLKKSQVQAGDNLA